MNKIMVPLDEVEDLIALRHMPARLCEAIDLLKEKYKSTPYKCTFAEWFLLFNYSLYGEYTKSDLIAAFNAARELKE